MEAFGVRVAGRFAGRAALVILTGGLAVGVAGCGSADGSGGQRGSGSPAGEGGLGAAPTTSSEPSPGSADGNTNGGQSSGGGNSVPTKAASPSGPTIVSFKIKQKPQCPAGTTVAPQPGVPLIIEWKATGADQAVLSVDGPGPYNTYGAEGSETFTFSCGGAPGTVEKHTYTIRVESGGRKASKTLTASATVNEIPQV
jgi:hypothetical protein